MGNDKDPRITLERLLDRLEERVTVSPALHRHIDKQEKVMEAFVSGVKGKIVEYNELIQNFHSIFEPEGRENFLEVGDFQGYTALHFFYSLGELIDKSLGRNTQNILIIAEAAESAIEKFDWRHHSSPRNSILEQEIVAEKTNLYGEITLHVITIIKEGILPFEQFVKTVYKRTIDHYRYLQKRFLNIGVDDYTRSYRNPWDDDEKSGFDLNRIEYMNIELIRDNALLTDLLLDIAQRLPRYHRKRQKQAGKKGYKEVRYLDDFEQENAARVLIELADPQYQQYIENARIYTAKMAENIKQYYRLFSAVETHLRAIVDIAFKDPAIVGAVPRGDFAKNIANPLPLLQRLQAINFNSILPDEEDIKPSGDLQRKYAKERKKLLEHLVESLDSLKTDQSYDEKLVFAKEAIKKAVELKEKTEKILQTQYTIDLKRDKNTDNEFYVGSAGDHGAFAFKREPAPNVKLKDVIGKSFDTMKDHLADLADYSKYVHLYGATAPRGKIRSNLIAIGPYGCGKTEIGRAIAADKRFIGAEVTITDLLTCWFGEFEKNVDRVWDAAQEIKKNNGDSKLVFLLMDEFDSWFGNTNGHWVDQTYKRVQKAIQIKLDGVVDYPGIITVGFTNEPAKIPLAIYRRFKYVEVVGELDAEERVDLLRNFLTKGLPLSRGFTEAHYTEWAALLDGATGDVIGKVADDIHYEFMRQFISEHPKESRRLNAYVLKMKTAEDKGKELDRKYIKREMGQYQTVTPDWVHQKIVAKVNDPIIIEQVDTAKRVYAEARDVLANLHRRNDDASACIVKPDSEEALRYRKGTDVV